MRDVRRPRHKTLFLTLAAILVVWGLLGLRNIASFVYSGYTTDGNNTVIHVDEASPAARAGMEVGDVLIRIRGVAVEDTRGQSQLPRLQSGELSRTVVQRNDIEVPLLIEHAPQTRRDAVTSYVVWLMGALFLACGIWAYFKTPNPGTTVWAMVGVCFSFAFLVGPHIRSTPIRNAVGALVIPVIFLGFGALVDFLVRAGRPGGYTGARGAPTWIFVPPLAVGILLAALILFQPAATSSLNVAVRTIVGIFLVGYLGAAVALVLRNYMRATPQVRYDRQLGLMLFAAMVGIVPGLIINLVGLVSPSTFISARDYLFLTMVVVPVAFAFAAVSGSRSEAYL